MKRYIKSDSQIETTKDYAYFKEYCPEVYELAAIIRDANSWLDVLDECEEIVKLEEIWGDGILREEWDDPETDVETVMLHAGKIFGVDIY